MPEPTATGSAPPPLKEAMGWIGFRADDMNGARVGRVLGVEVDASDAEPVWVVVKLGRFGKVTAVPYGECADGPGRIWIAHGRKVIRGAPPIEGDSPLTREHEIALCEHYFIPPDRGRHAAIADRAPETLTAKPASGAGADDDD